jgi:hypothetical protein
VPRRLSLFVFFFFNPSDRIWNLPQLAIPRVTLIDRQLGTRYDRALGKRRALEDRVVLTPGARGSDLLFFFFLLILIDRIWQQ